MRMVKYDIVFALKGIFLKVLGINAIWVFDIALFLKNDGLNETYHAEETEMLL